MEVIGHFGVKWDGVRPSLAGTKVGLAEVQAGAEPGPAGYLKISGLASRGRLGWGWGRIALHPLHCSFLCFSPRVFWP